MGSGASVIDEQLEKSLAIIIVEDEVKIKWKIRFDLAGESTLTDCFLARASWYRMNAQGAYRRRDTLKGTLSVEGGSAFLSIKFYQRLQSTYHSILLQKSAAFKSLFLQELCTILLAGVASFDAVGHFYSQFKAIPVREYGLIGETLIETLMEVLSSTQPNIKNTSTGDLTPLTFDLISDSDVVTDFTSTRITDRTTASVEVGEGEEGGEEGWSSKSQDSSQSMVLAWIRLYGKFLRHLWAVWIGCPQPQAHFSMRPSSQKEEKEVCVLEGIEDVEEEHEEDRLEPLLSSADAGDVSACYTHIGSP
ncbi:hypothetical protein B484DRAFT_483795 [Ochromonadaceae sp. CCMP2298]|nr:hypothetical protein B484DRAFT_483795 [Ochromonadaceae sp. CCMP2298]